jgi:hypothetical protein
MLLAETDRVSALLLARDLDVFATLDLVLDVLVLATAFPLDLALALVMTLVMDLRLALAIRSSRYIEQSQALTMYRWNCCPIDLSQI